ncbi:hypothetical protein [Bufonid herpesvirus 1]|uniref:hypothetical protein n=1 Tax=Bufonid herpesvirus 1 TaxID=2282206 RepID=UPI000EB6DCF9|nr:hypothetical protein [Bufonid herpesvirus 1]AXF48640.1 hypothetical protein [Bufonid herpesvirus 1]
MRLNLMIAVCWILLARTCMTKQPETPLLSLKTMYLKLTLKKHGNLLSKQIWTRHNPKSEKQILTTHCTIHSAYKIKLLPQLHVCYITINVLTQAI